VDRSEIIKIQRATIALALKNVPQAYVAPKDATPHSVVLGPDGDLLAVEFVRQQELLFEVEIHFCDRGMVNIKVPTHVQEMRVTGEEDVLEIEGVVCIPTGYGRRITIQCFFYGTYNIRLRLGAFYF
jgi:hypothetical protein